ncbi:MAG: hypothetical protein ACYCO9_06275 [Streptosporangiaceae bacterium]
MPCSQPPPIQADHRFADVLDLLAGLVAVGLVIVTIEGHPSVPRVLLTLLFTAYVPGRAIVANWPAIARWSEVILAFVFSLAALGLAAMTALWAHYWHPVGLFQVEAGLSVVGLAFAGYRRRRRPVGDRGGNLPGGEPHTSQS